MKNATSHNIFLVGPMGVGKTTIGRQLARELDKNFYDSDHEIVARTGADIPLIFDLEGEQGFRKREQETIEDLTQLENIVLATGGGAVLSEANRSRLADRGMVIYLQSDLDSLLERTHKDRNRPLLHADEPPDTILRRLLEQREPLYLDVADFEIHTGHNSIRSVIKAIIDRL
jgi:shikimate kinase